MLCLLLRSGVQARQEIEALDDVSDFVFAEAGGAGPGQPQQTWQWSHCLLLLGFLMKRNLPLCMCVFCHVALLWNVLHWNVVFHFVNVQENHVSRYWFRCSFQRMA